MKEYLDKAAEIHARHSAQAAAEQPEREEGDTRHCAMCHRTLKVCRLDIVNCRLIGKYAHGYNASNAIEIARSHQAQAVEGREEFIADARFALQKLEGLALMADKINPDSVSRWAHTLRCLIDTPPTQQEALAPVVPADWPTEEMVTAGADALWHAPTIHGERMSIAEWKGTARSIIEAALSATPSPQAVPEGFVLVPKWFIEFLHGQEAHPNGKWFGEPFANKAYWWRADLRAFTAAAPPAPAKDDPGSKIAYKATDKFGHICHFGARSLAEVWAKGGTVEEVPLGNLIVVTGIRGQ